MHYKHYLRFAFNAYLLTGSAHYISAQEPSVEKPDYMLRSEGRLVLEDVLVMDARGNPVHGLPATAFHIADNGVPQQVNTFEEGSPAIDSSHPAASLPPGTFSNASATDAAVATEVLLVDTDDMELVDQMYLLAQLKKAIRAMPDRLTASLFSVRAGRAVPLLINTTDREALVRVAEDMLPVQTHAIDDKFQSAVNQLMSAAAYLQQTPGRKNLLWFAGMFPLVSADGMLGNDGPRADYSQREHEIHQIQEALAEARISVYPVDVRGVLATVTAPLTTGGPSAGAVAGRNPRATNAASQKRAVTGPAPPGEAENRSEMRALADATGGRAYFLNNLGEEISQAFELGTSAYTVGYSPKGYKTDESYHKVTVTVDGGYALSYRKGYVATWSGVAGTEPRYKLLAGTRQKVDPNQRKPLVFQVQVEPQADFKRVIIKYMVALDQLSAQPVSGGYSTTLNISSYAYDSSGRVKDAEAQELNTVLTAVQYSQARAGGKSVASRQEISVPKGAKYLLFLVRDKGSQRTGSLLLQTRILANLPVLPSTADASKPTYTRNQQ